MDTNDTITVLFVTPNTTRWAHFSLVAQAVGAATIEIFEGATTSNNGTAITRWNRNRNSATESTTLAFHTPTVTADGTKMVSRWIGSTGVGGADITGEHRGDAEFVLKQNTKYLIRGTANANGIKISIGGDWYEHTNS